VKRGEGEGVKDEEGGCAASVRVALSTAQRCTPRDTRGGSVVWWRCLWWVVVARRWVAGEGEEASSSGEDD